MIFKLSQKNVKKSIQEYLIYFFTLTMAVALSYVFNLLPYQPFMGEFAEGAANEISELLAQLTIPITLIVAGLVTYSNMFLLKRRSREMGIYMMLGMRYSQVHLLILGETFLISTLSFVFGTGLGMLSSRGFDLLITNLLGLTIEKASIIFELHAFSVTLISFIVIFLLISILNYVAISKAKLINMVSARGEKSVKPAGRLSIYFNTGIFALSIFGLVMFYQTLLTQSLDFANKTIQVAIALGLLGHIGIFIAGSGILAYFIGKNKRLLYKGMNLFTLKQITRKVKVNGMVLSAISLMMAVTLVLLCMGVSNRIWVDSSLQEKGPYSISISSIEPFVDNAKIESFIQDKGYTITDSLSFPVYYTPYKWGDFLNVSKTNILYDSYEYQLTNSVKAISLKEYNKIRALQNFAPITLNNGEYVVHTRNELSKALELKKQIILGDNKLLLAKNAIYTEPIGDEKYVIGGDITFIVPDNVVIQGDFNTKSMIINTKERNTKNLNYELQDYIGTTSGGHFVVTRSDVKAFNLKQASIVIFTGLFLGAILLMAGATILVLQQMTEVMENKRRYTVISKLGVSRKQINSSIFKQIAFYFIVPLSVSVVHSILGTAIISKYVILSSNMVLLSIGLSFLVFITIYVGYMLFTYVSCKKIV